MQQYQVTGMSCAACSARVEKAVSAVDGVTSCSVSLLTNSMGVEGTAKPEEIIAAVEAAGYGARQKGKEQQTIRKGETLSDRESLLLLRRLIVSLVFLIPLMYFSMGHSMWGWYLPFGLEHNPVAVGILQLLLSAAIMVVNQKFFISGFRGVLHRAPNMDTLVSLGALAAFGYSVYALFALSGKIAAGDHAAAHAYLHEFYFESAGMILTLITLGKLLEAKAKGRTTNALRGLMELAPQTAILLRDGKEIEVPVTEVRVDDIFLVRPGGKIPVDGIVLEGNGAVDESALTGESLPIDKMANDRVFAATINNSGYLKCRATKVGEDTALSKIIQMVSDASATKAPIAKTADRVSGVFVPAVLLISLVTLLIWLIVRQTPGFALARAIAVLVISCPCALGLATPVAIMVGSGIGARNGILFKTATALESTGRVTTVVLDKTGTVTTGNPTVTDLLPADGVSEEELLLLAGALESKSEHPLAKAIMEEVERREISVPEVSQFTALAGSGVTATLGEATILGGNQKTVTAHAPFSEQLLFKSESFAKEGKTPLFFAKGTNAAGIIAVADIPKQESADAIARLKKSGLRVVLLTGDNFQTANAIAKQVGIDEVIAEVLPDQKAEVVGKLQAEGEKVAMVGDGINDAPALTAADVGFAIGAGTDIAIDAADVVLVQSRLSDVPAAICIGKKTLRNIKENLFWAFFYNVIGIPLAAGVWYAWQGWLLNPMFGAAAMSLSSFCVVMNALRLNLIRIHPKAEKGKREKREEQMKETLKIEGMMCPHCEMHVKQALEALPTVESAEVSHKTGTAVVTLTAPTDRAVFEKAIADAGYQLK
ncbi:MAG: heavy metal translocating P-type ATPase [Ruminococcaceae bacterium]|nr:heavy metal translocating P-type ATPase [Oscillospiraceae bacterium]